MLIRGMLKRGDASEERDTRSAEAVLDAAAQHLGEPSMPAAARILETNGVRWAWQMLHLTDNDWDQLGISLGLKTAAKAELANPSAPCATAGVTEGEVTKRMQRFLLQPDAGGGEAKPLGSMSALFLGLLVMPVSERQSVLLSLCELLALVSGLFLPIPLEFRRIVGSSEVTKGWDEMPTLADGMDALVAMLFLFDAFVAAFSVCLAIYVASGGYHADDRFCEGAMAVMGVLLVTWMVGVFLPLLGLSFWHFFTVSASPYPCLACLVMVLLCNLALGDAVNRFFAEPLALEFYHTPRWFKELCRQSFPYLRHLLNEKAIRAAAERRAAQLHVQMRSLTADAGANGTALAAPPRRVALAVAP